jgi:hypothetical protein
MRVYLRLAGLPVGDGAVGEFEKLGAATAQLDGDFTQIRSAEFQPRGLAMIRTADSFQLASGILLKLFYGHPQSILAQECFLTAWHNLSNLPRSRP